MLKPIDKASVRSLSIDKNARKRTVVNDDTIHRRMLQSLLHKQTSGDHDHILVRVAIDAEFCLSHCSEV
jgi:hypothetical protein